jgi:mRNA interferase MazF
MTRGKVVLVAFPFDDLEGEKARPAVCLTDPLGAHRHIVLAFVTSRQPEDPLPTDITLDPNDPDFAETGLQLRSTIRTHRLLTVSSNVIKRELGHLAAGRVQEVSRKVCRLFESEAERPDVSASPAPEDEGRQDI